jgi:hypothetical protein
MLSRGRIINLMILSVLAAGFGLHVFIEHKGKPAMAGAVPETWPRNDSLVLSLQDPSLVMFAQPRCPCTKASIRQLATLTSQASGKFHASVVFCEPEDPSEMWTNTPTTRLARSIPGVHVVWDRGGRLAHRFGVETSGHTVLYHANGRLLFSGGIAGEHGRSESKGFDIVLNQVNQGPGAVGTKTKVFGCSLFEECDASAMEKMK